MGGLNMTFPGSTHDVVEYRCEFHDFKTVLTKIAIPANVTIMEAEHVTELMGKRAGGQVAGRQRNVAADKTVGRLSAGGENRPIVRESRRHGGHIDALSP